MLSWGYEGAAADLLLWMFIRLQTHMFASPAYSEVVSVVQTEEEVERAARKEEVAEWKREQAAAAVSESKQRAARALRISRIKAGVDRSLGRFGAGINPTGLDFAFLDPGEHIEPAAAEGPLGAAGSEATQRQSTLRNRRDTAYEVEGEFEAQGSENVLDNASEQAHEDVHLTEYERELAAASSADLATSARQTTRQQEGPTGPTLYSISEHQTVSRLWPRKVWSWISVRLRTADRRESALAYTLFVFAYLSDFSLTMLALPVSAFTYALVAFKPSRAYWQAVLVYCEVLIVASYAFGVPARLGCGFVTPKIEFM